jgi:hypothetical protein
MRIVARGTLLVVVAFVAGCFTFPFAALFLGYAFGDEDVAGDPPAGLLVAQVAAVAVFVLVLVVGRKFVRPPRK